MQASSRPQSSSRHSSCAGSASCPPPILIQTRCTALPRNTFLWRCPTPPLPRVPICTTPSRPPSPDQTLLQTASTIPVTAAVPARHLHPGPAASYTETRYVTTRPLLPPARPAAVVEVILSTIRTRTWVCRLQRPSRTRGRKRREGSASRRNNGDATSFATGMRG